MKNYRVLLIDDEEDVRGVLVRFFSKEGCEVFQAEDGIEGLEQIQAHTPHVVVMDIRMPRMDGLDLLDSLLAVEDRRALPILVIFSASLEPAIYAYARGRADLVIEKSSIQASTFVETVLALAATRFPGVSRADSKTEVH